MVRGRVFWSILAALLVLLTTGSARAVSSGLQAYVKATGPTWATYTVTTSPDSGGVVTLVGTVSVFETTDGMGFSSYSPTGQLVSSGDLSMNPDSGNGFINITGGVNISGNFSQMVTQPNGTETMYVASFGNGNANVSWYNVGPAPAPSVSVVDGPISPMVDDMGAADYQSNYLYDGGSGFDDSGYSGGGGACFAAGTLVDTAAGPKKIEQLAVGDKVFSYDEAREEVTVGTVEQTFVHYNAAYGQLRLSDGSELNVTSNHRFFVPESRAWVEAGRLRVGDHLLRRSGVNRADGSKADLEDVIVQSVAFPAKSLRATVYNIEVDSFHDYYVGGVLVHNKDCPDCGF